MLSAGKAAVRKLTRARILLKADRNSEAPESTDAAISAALGDAEDGGECPPGLCGRRLGGRLEWSFDSESS